MWRYLTLVMPLPNVALPDTLVMPWPNVALPVTLAVAECGVTRHWQSAGRRPSPVCAVQPIAADASQPWPRTRSVSRRLHHCTGAADRPAAPDRPLRHRAVTPHLQPPPYPSAHRSAALCGAWSRNIPTRLVAGPSASFVSCRLLKLQYGQFGALLWS